MTPVSIIIPTYNGLELLKNLLPSISNFRQLLQDDELIVVDDGSIDGTERYLRDHFPEISVIRLKRNLGFGRACDVAVSEARNRVIVILNNDVLIDSDFLGNVFAPFDKREEETCKIFAVTCKVLKTDKKTSYHSRNEGIFQKGEIVINSLADQNGSTFFASGVMMVFRKEIFLELGGFDDLYHPFYWEDVDLCYRAWKKGYQIRYEPEDLIYHKDQATTVFSNKGGLALFFAKMYARIIQERNQYLFTWKNILDTHLILAHIFWIPIHLILSFRNRDHIFKSIGFLFAVAKLNKALRKRREEREKEYILEDRQILPRV